METINIRDYKREMGPLIDVRHPLDYAKKHDPRSINIYADKLIMNHYKYLNKKEIFYITCAKGFLSKRVIRTLSFYGYKFVLVNS